MASPTKDQVPLYILIDGENIDRTLGQILEAKPRPEQRPRWDRVRQFAETAFGRPAKALFFLNAWRGLPGTFIQALRMAGYTPIPLSGDPDQKVVDIAMIRTLDAIVSRPGDVLLVSHDNDFRESFARLIDGQRRMGVLGFKEYLSGEYVELDGVELFDLEDDARAFDGEPLPRIRVIPLEQFDPNRYL